MVSELKMGFKRLENALFHFSNINTQENVYLIVYLYYMPIILVHVCALAYTSRHLASPDFLQKVVILYISTQDQDTVLCHKINMYFPLHTSQAFLSLFLPTWCICILLWKAITFILA